MAKDHSNNHNTDGTAAPFSDQTAISDNSQETEDMGGPEAKVAQGADSDAPNKVVDTTTEATTSTGSTSTLTSRVPTVEGNSNSNNNNDDEDQDSTVMNGYRSKKNNDSKLADKISTDMSSSSSSSSSSKKPSDGSENDNKNETGAATEDEPLVPVTEEKEQEPTTNDTNNTHDENSEKDLELQRLQAQIQNMEQDLSQQRQYNANFLQKLLEVKGNIQVYCRIRPRTQQEEDQDKPVVVEAMPNGYETACFDAKLDEYKSFCLDRTWGPQQSQLSVFQDVEPLAMSVVQGYNACILAYGQTGSGKTYTMQGEDENDWGISFRTLEKLWNLLSLRQEQEPNFVYTLKLGMLEIYNDEVYDLLNTNNANSHHHNNNASRRPKLDVRRNAEGRLEVPNQLKENVTSVPEVQVLMERAQQVRATATTNLNEHSSRSHMILSVDVSCGLQSPEPSAVKTNNGVNSQDNDSLNVPLQQQTKATLFLVDLAGSERVKQSQVEGEQLKEAGYINKSLSALGNVMEALDKKNSHIPYRDSKLTYLLQDALGGGGSNNNNNSRTMMIVNVSPVSLEESLNTLQFATRVRNIQLNTAQRSNSVSGSVVEKNLHRTIATLRQQVQNLQTAHDAAALQCHSLQKENARLQEQVHGLEKARQQARALQALQEQHSNLETKHEQESLARHETQQALRQSQEHVARLEQQLALVAPQKFSMSDDGSHTTLTTEDTGGEEFVAMVRQRVLELLQEHDPAKVDKIDALMTSFQGKESILLERMTQRYQRTGGKGSNGSTNGDDGKKRSSNGSFSFWGTAAFVVMASMGLYKFYNNGSSSGSSIPSPPNGSPAEV